MTTPIVLPDGVSFAVIAFLLSLLPAGLFIWLWYLRRNDRPVPVNTVSLAFLIGMILVWPAFKLEELFSNYWYVVSPSTAHYFAGAVLPLQDLRDVFFPAIGTFVVVATVEEGLRYLVLMYWLRRSNVVDQVFDGIVLGIAMGLGFATLENTLYFLNLFSQEHFDTLIFVFFLRFLISTLAHIGFGGIMGALIIRGVFQIYQPARRNFFIIAFLVPWFVHGLYDLLLGINQTVYAVLLLVPPLLTLVAWMSKREFFVIARDGGSVLVQPKVPVTRRVRAMNTFFKRYESPWNAQAPWLRERRSRYTFLRDLENPQ